VNNFDVSKTTVTFVKKGQKWAKNGKKCCFFDIEKILPIFQNNQNNQNNFFINS
jgi:hypothetical protein